mmetsp:Transcript_26822/g.37036  ORF Transcript_26822/g.37036 Transcript_26822/m.37036 type:complete len:142 (+) Transcript_26822:107-532(+)
MPSFIPRKVLIVVVCLSVLCDQQRLPRLIGANRANEVSLIGTPVKADKALEWGLVNQIVPQDDLIETCIKIAKKIVSKPHDVVSKFKSITRDGLGMCLQDGRKEERRRGFEHYRNMPKEDFERMRVFIENKGNKSKLDSKL